MCEVDNSEDILRELNEAELLELENLYKNGSKELIYHYLSIYNQRIWDKKLIDLGHSITFKSEPLRKKFYTHRNGNLQKNGTYFSFAVDCKTTISCHSFQTDLTELRECLKHTKRINWLQDTLFAGLHSSIMPLVEKQVAEKNGSIARNRECHLFLCENITARNIRLNQMAETLTIRPLSKENIQLIHSLWPNNKEASVDFLLGLITLNRSLGLFENNSLIGWIFQNEFAGTGILNTVPEQRRKGYALLLTQIMTKEIASADPNIDVSAFVVYDNESSQQLLNKVGYQKTAITFWMQLANQQRIL